MKSSLNVLVEWMSGAFSSEEQAAENSDFYHISLHMCPFRKEQEKNYWLYVEQSMADALETPYRQRVYMVSQIEDDTFESKVFALKDPFGLRLAWKTTQLLGKITLDDLEVREGCSINLRYVDNKFVGSTIGQNCQSVLNGASYATSDVTISATELMSWDRGFNQQGQQVWGAVSGGYIFKKFASFSLP